MNDRQLPLPRRYMLEHEFRLWALREFDGEGSGDASLNSRPSFELRRRFHELCVRRGLDPIAPTDRRAVALLTDQVSTCLAAGVGLAYEVRCAGFATSREAISSLSERFGEVAMQFALGRIRESTRAFGPVALDRVIPQGRLGLVLWLEEDPILRPWLKLTRRPEQGGAICRTDLKAIADEAVDTFLGNIP